MLSIPRYMSPPVEREAEIYTPNSTWGQEIFVFGSVIGVSFEVLANEIHFPLKRELIRELEVASNIPTPASDANLRCMPMDPR